MRCSHVTYRTQPVHFDFFVGAPMVIPCQREALPKMQKCEKHATRDELVKAIKDKEPKGL